MATHIPLRLILLAVVLLASCDVTSSSPVQGTTLSEAVQEEIQPKSSAAGEAAHEKAADEKALAVEDKEGRQCTGNNCHGFGATNTWLEIGPPTSWWNWNLNNWGVGGLVGLGNLDSLKDLGILGLTIPILILEIITLSLVGWLVKKVKKHDDHIDGYIASYPSYSSHDSGYGHDYEDSHFETGYRQYVPDETTMSWIFDRISNAVDWYSAYQNLNSKSDNEKTDLVEYEE